MVRLDEVIQRAQKNVNDIFEIKGLFSKQEWKNASNVQSLGKPFLTWYIINKSKVLVLNVKRVIIIQYINII